MREQIPVLTVEFKENTTLEEAEKIVNDIGLIIKYTYQTFWEFGLRILAVVPPTREIKLWISEIKDEDKVKSIWEERWFDTG